MIAGEPPKDLTVGWQDPQIPDRQRLAIEPLLRAMREGHPREDFVALAEAVRATGLTDPLIVEVGCSSGWNGEVLSCLLGRPVQYIGLDYSRPMVHLARRLYPQWPFVAGDATALPLRDACCDVLVSGTVLMHVVGYQRAILESRRVSRRWCIFHTVPIVQHRGTALLMKPAYGSRVVDVVFNETELLAALSDAGLVVRRSSESLSHSYLEELMGERVPSRTYLCERA